MTSAIPGNMADFSTAQYLLVAEPHTALTEEIRKLKQYFASTYDCPAAAAGKSNITLARFEQYEMLESKILHRLKLVATAQSSFIVELHDFGSFPTHTIFLNITTKTQWVQLARSLRPMQQLLTIDKERKVHIITDPYIPIARKLLPWQYEKGWLEYSHTHFSGRFVLDQLVLLRKRTGETNYSSIGKFKLMNVKEEIKQGQLF
jgi:2'-5' RNA ligase